MVGILIRKALKDFEIKGYHIPKVGYLMAPCFDILTRWRLCSRTARGRNVEGGHVSQATMAEATLLSYLSLAGTGSGRAHIFQMLATSFLRWAA